MQARLVAALLALSLFATGCSGESAGDGTGNMSSPVASGDNSSSSAGQNEVPPVLDFLGDLAQPRGPRMTTALDTTAGAIALDEGVSVVVAAGAFNGQTALTTQVVDLDFGTVLGDTAPWSRAYVVSTVDDVSLGAPVTIEIPRPAAELRAIQVIDGVILPVQVVGDATSAQIEIPHFSEVVTLVLNTWGEEAAALARAELAELPQAGADTPANFLLSCLVAVLGLWGGFSDDGVDELYSDIAYALCTNALISRSAPDGEYVSTECVGDRIGGGVDFQEAVDSCAADRNGDGADVSDTDGAAETAAGGQSAAENSDSESSVGVDVLYSGQANAGAISDSAAGSYRYQSVGFEARVEGDMVTMTVTTSLFIWWRGGDDGGPSGDQNCGGTINETLRGSGPVGSPTRIDLIVVSSDHVDTAGVLCQGDEPARDLHDVGQRVASFQGQVNGVGFDGDFVANPSLFSETRLALEAN